MRPSFFLGLARFVIIFVAIGSPAFGQSPIDSAGVVAARGTAELAQGKATSAADPKADMEGFLRTRAELFEEMSAARKDARDDSPEARMQALDEWFRRNSSRIEAVQQQAVRLAKAQAPLTLVSISEVGIPADASAEMEEFLVERAKLLNERAAIQERFRQSPAGLDQAVQEWQQKNAARNETQQERARIIADQNKLGPIPMPAVPLIPQDASVELRDFLTERHALILERAQMEARSASLDATAKAEASARWQNESSVRFQRLSEKARAISEQKP